MVAKSSPFRDLAVAILFSYASLTLLWTLILWFVKRSINWESRTIASTCYDPDGDFWGNPAYDGIWTLCDQSGDGTCTPWGYACIGNENLADLCPLDFGGTGDGCRAPSVMATVIDMYIHPGWVQDPMWAGQVGMQTALVFFIAPAVALIVWCIWEGRACSQGQQQQKHVPLKVAEEGGFELSDYHDNTSTGSEGSYRDRDDEKQVQG